MPIYKMDGKMDRNQKYRVRINYVDSNGNKKQIDRVVYGRSQAKELEAKLLSEIKDAPSQPKMTVQQLYDDYISTKKYEVRESTLNKSSEVLTNHILPELKKTKITKLAPPILQKWKKHIEDKELSLGMRKSIYREFRTMLNYAMRMEYIHTNPLSKVGNFKDAYETKKEPSFYTSEEFLKFISAARKCAKDSDFFEWNYYAFFNIAFYTGLRKGELSALKWSDIEDNILHVRRSIAQKLNGADRETPPKSKSSFRSLQIPEPLQLVLDEHYARYKNLDMFTDDWRICGGLGCLRDTTVDLRNRQYAAAAGVKHIRIHDFRHSHATLLANEGINIQEIARRLGHSKIEITWNTYSHLYPREEEKAVGVLNKIVYKACTEENENQIM
jgi:Site-specific recombinase XerD